MTELLPLAAAGLFIAIAAYFKSRQDSAPSRTERVAAMLWLLFRRIVCFSAAALCLMGSVLVAYSMLASSATWIGAIGIAVALSFSFIFAHLGMYGSGKKRYDVTEDRPVHDARRKRYGWRW